MKRAPRSLQHHVLYRKYNGQDSEISALLGKCGIKVFDIAKVFMKWGLLFHCDEYGVDAGDLDVIAMYKGEVREVPYKEWLSDGKGGLPRALKTPEGSFDRHDCERAFDSWIALWDLR